MLCDQPGVPVPQGCQGPGQAEMAAWRRNIGGQTVLTKDILIRGGREARMGWEQHLVRTWRRSSVLLRGDKRGGRRGCLRRGENSEGRAVRETVRDSLRETIRHIRKMVTLEIHSETLSGRLL